MLSSWDEVIGAVVDDSSDLSWGICVLDEKGEAVAEHHADLQMWTASVGKVLLFVELARELEVDPELGALPLNRGAVSPVGEAGLWQYLRTDSLPLEDVVVLAASLSDNLATNVLLNRVGLERVDDLRASLGLQHTALLDRVRAERTGAHPPNISSASASELASLMLHLSTGHVLSAEISGQVARWLSLNADQSLVAAAFGLDPLAHAGSSDGLTLFNKTGSDPGVRADTGVLEGRRHRLAYAVIANWNGDGPDLKSVAVKGMRLIGDSILRGAQR